MQNVSRQTLALLALASTLAVGIGVGRWLLPASEPAARETKPAAKPAATIVHGAPVSRVQAGKAGFDPAIVGVEEPVVRKVALDIGVPGKIAFNAERMKLASARVAGRIERILAFEGSSVRAGQPLAELYSPEYVSAQNEYLLAAQTVRTFERAGQRELLDDARATLESAANKLRVLGAAQEDIDRLVSQGRASVNLTIRAPIGGVIAKRNFDPGAYLNIGDSLMSIVDPGSLWFVGNVFEQDIRRIAIGQKLVLRTESLPGESFEGVVSYIAPAIDPATHTLAVRCDVSSHGGRLKPEMFVNARLVIGRRDALVVPKAAIVRMRGADYVVVEQPDRWFERMPVRGDDLGDGSFAVFEGLPASRRVVVRGATLVNEMISKQEN